MHKKSLLLIMEKDLENRFLFFEEYAGIRKEVLNLKNSLLISKFKTIATRLSYGKVINSEFNKLGLLLKEIDVLFISNPEGYIAKNIIYKIRAAYPHLKIISLQHGIFAMTNEIIIKKVAKNIVNRLGFILFKTFFIGDGFGVKSTDKYIVYNVLYKNYLIWCGWKEADVIVSSYLLKGAKEENLVVSKVNGSAVFFLQCLQKLGIASKKVEEHIITTVVQKLKKKYTNVLLKQHPYANIDIPRLLLDEKCREIEILPELESISLIVSCFSTALLEYEKFGITTIAIYSKDLNVDATVYEQFMHIYDFDEKKNEDDFSFRVNEKRKNLPLFFTPGERKITNIGLNL